MKHIKITPDILNTENCINFISSNEAGGHNLFIGKVRSSTKDKKVQRLEFEAYEAMAVSELNKIADKALKKWPVFKIWIEHRTGTLTLGDAAVVIGVCCPHRAQSFEACQFVIDELKKSVPIWKKEVFEDGEVWVAAHP
jgi:molybdopterin synthase catalytic subunit